uniref:Dynein light chain Tctex-type 2 n=1 Tax=Salvator merianae TaxID=96440 RepID=A0A8D0EB39_SALMN
MDKFKKRLSITPSHQLGGLRKFSTYDREGLGGRPSQSGRHRTSSHDFPGSDDESVTDFTRNELLAFKTSFARPRYANTYRMEPYKKFQDHVARKKIEEILKHKLQEYKYSGLNASIMCTAVVEDVLGGVKELYFDRYKYIVQVFLVQKTGQSIHIASRWVWDAARDNWVQAQHETEDYIAVVLVVAGYHE